MSGTTRAQFRAMQETLTVQVPRQNAEAARALLARTAEAERRRVLTEQQARAGIAPTLATVVDGARGAAPAAVRPDGYILLEWGYVREVALVALESLRAAGPRETGDWALNIAVLADGNEVDAETIPHMARLVHIIPTQPYSRRLEIGRTRTGDPFVLDDDDYKLIERTANRFRRIYAEVARVDFTFVDLGGAYRLRSGAARGIVGRDVRYPAMTIKGWQVS